MPTKNLPPIQPRNEAVVIYKQERAKKKGLLPGFFARFGINVGGGSGVGGFGSVASSGGSFLNTFFSSGLLTALATSKAAFVVVGLSIVSFVVGIGVLVNYAQHRGKGP